MNEPTNPLAESPDPPMRRRAEAARVVDGAGIGATPARVERTAPIAYVSTVISILRRKRDRYKSAGKADKANTVESCIQTLKEWAK